MSDLADKTMLGLINGLGKLLHEPAPIPAPEPIIRMPFSLTRNWADCPLCTRSVDRCDCDPNDYAAAVYAKLNTPAQQSAEREG